MTNSNKQAIDLSNLQKSKRSQQQRKYESAIEHDIHTYIYIYIYREREREREIRGAYDKFPIFFGLGIYNCRKLLKIQYVIAIHLMT